MVDLTPAHLAQVKSILSKHVPNVTCKAFGSRVTGKATRFSDLDLVLIADAPILVDTLNELKFAFSNSDLPIMVDVVDWHAMSKEFQHIVEANCEIL
jgi:uncharacterized protein